MSVKIYSSARGKTVDMGALRLKNEQVRAVGNMGVNARGDRIDSQGNIIDPKNQQTLTVFILVAFLLKNCTTQLVLHGLLELNETVPNTLLLHTEVLSERFTKLKNGSPMVTDGNLSGKLQMI